MLTLLSSGSTSISAQGSEPSKSPTEVIQAYRQMDAAGGRLNVSGWYGASTFFLKPGRTPQSAAIMVIDGERVDHHRINGNKAEVQVPCSEVGQIDSEARFTSVVYPPLVDHTGRPPRVPGTPQLHGPEFVIPVYELVLTDTYWEFGPGREGPREVKGHLEWRIEHFEFEPRVTIEAAVRYLTQLRDESSSEIIKRNAEKSIAALRRLH